MFTHNSCIVPFPLKDSPTLLSNARSQGKRLFPFLYAMKLWPRIKHCLPFNSSKYWESRYAAGGNSGAGSRGHLAQYKADFLNTFFEQHSISTVVEWGAGDGYQAGLLQIEHYTGLDVSTTAVAHCRQLHVRSPHLHFYGVNEVNSISAQVALSLDVLYHLIENRVYKAYLDRLFASAQLYVVIYACDREGGNFAKHVKPRKFTRDVAKRFPNWELILHEPNPFPLEQRGAEEGSWSDFFVYKKRSLENVTAY